MSRQTLGRTLVHAAAIGVVLAGYACLQPTSTAAGTLPQPVKTKRIAQIGPAGPIDFPTLVERYGPAVVSVSVAAPEPQMSASGLEALDPDDPFSAYFKLGVPQPPTSQDSAPRAMAGAGSGFIVSADGLILTTAYVVGQASEVTVRLIDRREFNARVLAVDDQSDVAVLQVDATKLPTVRLGDSSRVRVGEPVLTIGTPDGSANTVTTGIVSATSRTLPDGGSFPFFQTDVTGNLDNSGGPVFNRAGEVIGIDVQIYAGGDRYPGVTFAIPINLAAKVRTQVLQAQQQARQQARQQAQQTQQAQRAAAPGGLGVDVQDVGPGLAAAFGLPRSAGALVNAVEPGSPAAAIGLQPGDVIVRIGDKPIGRSAELAGDVAALPPGTNTTLTLLRNRAPMTLMLGPGAAAGTVAGTSSGSASVGRSEVGGADRLGLTMHPLTDDERRSTGLPVGMVVDAVRGPAAGAGIQPGDVVLEFNDTLIETPDMVPTLEAKAGKVVAVLIQRGGERKFVSVRLR
ncbi:trypsin-like peptidase domain-containing protein [Burkholderia oklahomensis]|uniref:Probable periplasmic serine endoprotease DegP-like n=1 Tax=Burkholderia oklahomensis TaxID=342113 RepID=A0AAI8B8K4_9BURK|nr:trypsin-like peptidase domain-containing protein [Burkholderia oklahomensis]AIO67732.1 PDZ domain protein [Burkholderia oklahomensis]AOI42748.1 peptidase S1 [Burkholderia oklahomensis EO147]KUY57228.1 peptidase S1 [Burkholderia oklahomensis EO147]QPS37490.1 trypsin-like peptidase domain-containing protein [Burkholderia oklahomensis]